MSSFTDAKLAIQYEGVYQGEDYWSVTKPFIYYLGELGSGRYVVIPVGYITDGASVPKIFRNLLPCWGIYGPAAVVHDRLCETLEVFVDGVPVKITRAQADEIFKEAMEALKTPTWKVNLMYGAVRGYAKLMNITEPSGLKDLNLMKGIV